MNYKLNAVSSTRSISSWGTLCSLLAALPEKQRKLWKGGLAILLNSTANLVSPFVIGFAIDRYVQHKRYAGVVGASAVLLCLYITAFLASHFQNKIMGGMGLQLVFALRNTLFNKLQLLPVAFFNANPAGDLIFRVNSDLEKLNTFISQSLVAFLGSSAVLVGSGVFLITLQARLALAVFIPAIFILVFTWLTAPWVKRRNALSLQYASEASAQVHENLSNFRLFSVFNRLDYMRQRFAEANLQQYRTAVRAALADNLFLPVYTLFSNAAQLIALTYGLYQVAIGQGSIGQLISCLLFTTLFYNAARMLATLWSNFQHAAAGWERISEVLSLPVDLPVLAATSSSPKPTALVELRNVCFGYKDGTPVLNNVSMRLESGKTYALVGPTGGGKTTLASLIARLYDPSQGAVCLAGQDLRTYTPEERARKIGFILQDPFLFTGTMRENILYGNELYHQYDNEQVQLLLQTAKIHTLISFFEDGLDTQVSPLTGSVSLGQKQLIAFMRVMLRSPELLILDEATANIDPETEQLLDEILCQLPTTTTRVIIAHRLNTIANADEIYFVNNGGVVLAGSLTDAIDKLRCEGQVS